MRVLKEKMLVITLFSKGFLSNVAKSQDCIVKFGKSRIVMNLIRNLPYYQKNPREKHLKTNLYFPKLFDRNIENTYIVLPFIKNI